MSLDMYGMIEDVFNFDPVPVTLFTFGAGDYTGAGGVWEDGLTTSAQIYFVNIQPSGEKEFDLLEGGVKEPRDFRVLHLNDGTMLYPDDENRPSNYLAFTDGIADRAWRVVRSDCRPHRNFCRAVVERYNPHG